MAFESPIGRKMVQKNMKNRLLSPKHSFLSTYLMQERRKDVTQFDEYLDILPKDLSCFPIFFKPEEKAWLKGSPFLTQVEEKIEDIRQDYDLLCKEIPEYE